MSRITVVGGTGYAGAHIASEAASRGHQVTALSRKAPEQPIDGVTYQQVDLLNSDTAQAATADADVVVVALSPRGALDGKIREVVSGVARSASQAGARLGVVGGAGSLKVSEDGPLVKDTEGFPEAFFSEATQMGEVLEDLRAGESQGEWFYISPAGGFGGFAPGERTGEYRTGGDVLLTDESGNSFISGADFAIAVVDEIEKPAHENQRFTVAY